ncbi:MAG TPA: histidine phosphatase family protein [Terrimesophilobacter sp.]|nr:histidine phosphatase family protein [Terrimesophilobacter sp.]HRQ00565.1 histidine phosphatase family protein [Terrimesophilobacter sp.]
MTLFYLVRHGETDWNRQHRVQGSSDIPLNETGKRQAKHTALLLARRSFDAIYTSPLSRASETASIIAEDLGLGHPIDHDAFVERNYGDAEGLTRRAIDARWGATGTVPGQETRRSVQNRVIAALHRLADGSQGKHFIVVTHGGVIRSMLYAIEATPHRSAPITNGSIHSFELVDGTLALITFNDPIEHASALPGDDDITDQNPVEAADDTPAPKEKNR